MPTGITIAGKGSLRLAGKVYNCTKFAVTYGAEKVEKIVGMGGVAGDKVTPVAPKIDATIIVTRDVLLSVLAGLRNVRAEGSFADGRAFVATGASNSDQLKYSAEDGTVDVSLEAISCLEV